MDDNFPDHPKVAELTDEAFRLYVEGLCYSSRLLTDGAIPRRLGREPQASELVEAGLWDVAEKGFQVHDFLAYNPSAADVKARREAAQERTKKWRDASRNASRDGGGDASGDASPTRPDPARKGRGRVSAEPPALLPPIAPSGVGDRHLPVEQVEMNVLSIREARSQLRGETA